MSVERYGMESCYNSNTKLKKARIAIEITEEEKAEYERCYHDIEYFLSEYCYIVNMDEGLVKFKPYKYQKKAVKLMHKHRFSIMLMARQMGKALCVDTPIPTPNGFKLMGDIQVGDQVFGRDGKTYEVTFATGFQQDRTCYNITFDDGSSIVADAEHIWTVRDKSHLRRHKGVERDLTTQQMVDAGLSLSDGGRKYSILNTAPVEMGQKDLPVDPYLMGYWLGDGNSAGARITYHEKDGVILEYIRSLGFEVSEYSDLRRPSVKNANIRGLLGSLRSAGVLGDKHIPDSYLWASVEQRAQILKGLMDSDGCTSAQVRGNTYNNKCEFSNKNERLADGVVHLARSLGLKPVKRQKIVNGTLYYLVRFTAYSDHGIGAPFSLQRKADRIGPRGKYEFTTSRTIVSIEQVESRPVKCIQVNAPDHIFLAGEQFVPTHNTTVVAGYLLHAAIFNKSYNIAILANKGSQAQEIMERLQAMYEELPWFLQPGVKVWNKKSITLGNGTRVFTASTSSSSIRGRSLNIVYLDEFAFVDNAVEFYTSTYPVITSGKNTKIIITSTPNGMNLFYKMWMDAVNGKSKFASLRVDWDQHPNRNKAWKDEQLANMDERQFLQEFCNEFFGSSDTLISGNKLQSLATLVPIKKDKHSKIFKMPVKDHAYVATVDVSEGIGKDHSVVNVFDVSQTPYEQVAIYRNNTVSPIMLAHVAAKMGKLYNEAMLVVESNSIGSNTCNTLWYDLEYENMLRTRVVKSETATNSGASSELGLRMTTKSKAMGCANLKDLIENDVLVVVDETTIEELTTFTKNANTWKAEKNKHDDCVMTLVSFAWFVDQPYFGELVDINTRNELMNRMLEEDMPMGIFVSDGINDEEVPFSFKRNS